MRVLGLSALVLVVVTACGGSGDGGKAVARAESSAPADSGVVVDGGDDTGDLLDSGGGLPDDRPPPYCRSLDPDWAAAYTSSVDRALAALIEEHELQGDARVYVDAEGRCAWRDLPGITDPLPTLGRALFFSLDLSGDHDVACATCHHPELGGGDALSLSLGPGFGPSLMGADRARGLSDPARIEVHRNAPTTFNIGLWDRSIFWDGHVEALEPTPGAGGVGDAIAADDVSIDTVPATLPEVQAHIPVTKAHEMAGTWGAAFSDPDALRDALAERLAGDAAWVARFRAVCGPGLPESWRAACDADDPARLVTFDHIALAIGEYERSQVFTDTPWAAYVQGDVDAIDDTVKQGALVFFRELADGGQGCARCHAGDLFSDEDFHAIGGHQIGPGTGGTGADPGRSAITGDSIDLNRFRTPTLLNVEATAPYFHAGSMASLTQAVVFYRNIPSNIAEYFGAPGAQDLHPRPWCRMTQFADLPGCDALYTIDHTLGGAIEGSIDEDAADIGTFQGEVSAQVVAFLRALTDPRVLDPAAMAPWVEPGAVPQVTETSSEWDAYCEVMTERPAALNLRAKGFRWVATGEVVGGLGINADAPLYDLFGLGYWAWIDPDFPIYSGLERQTATLATLTLEVMDPAQRAVLYDAYRAIVEAGDHATVLERRTALFDDLGQARAGEPSSAADRRTTVQELSEAEGAVVVALARAYRDALLVLPEADRDAHRAVLQAVVDGNLAVVPEGIYDPYEERVDASAAVAAELAALDLAAGPDFPTFVAQYATFWTSRACQLAFMSRLDIGARRANFFGFLPWSNRYLFDLDTGREGPGPVMAEMSGLVRQKERALGLEALAAASADASITAQRAHNAVRDTLAAALVQYQSPTLGETDLDTLRLAVLDGHRARAEHEADQLEAELDYFLALWSGLDAAGNTDLTDYLACLESPETQAMRGAGGFDALGGGSCVP